jgi:hypothetical protein
VLSCLQLRKGHSHWIGRSDEHGRYAAKEGGGLSRAELFLSATLPKGKGEEWAAADPVAKMVAMYMKEDSRTVETGYLDLLLITGDDVGKE